MPIMHLMKMCPNIILTVNSVAGTKDKQRKLQLLHILTGCAWMDGILDSQLNLYQWWVSLTTRTAWIWALATAAYLRLFGTHTVTQVVYSKDLQYKHSGLHRTHGVSYVRDETYVISPCIVQLDGAYQHTLYKVVCDSHLVCWSPIAVLEPPRSSHRSSTSTTSQYLH